ncbi:DUF2510 domain-containing protein [Nocardia jejuensis]|uniref:DUF2510 domain-containing protein n=1 Tax=Nocardia jejuensis TaxID=328049 RepID=UPI00082E5E28|nr:DUF2510 domain-containing protein [Nocardia jejuensis]
MAVFSIFHLLILVVIVLIIAGAVSAIIIAVTRKSRGGVAPGWYPDPGGAPLLRYHDGREWTSATRPSR